MNPDYKVGIFFLILMSIFPILNFCMQRTNKNKKKGLSISKEEIDKIIKEESINYAHKWRGVEGEETK